MHADHPTQLFQRLAGEADDRGVGAWGTAILSNDTSADVRERFRDLVSEGGSAGDATDSVLATFADELADPDAAPDVWLGLALAQFQTGRLQERVRDRAIALIDDGTDLERWRALGAGSAYLRKRRAALGKLRKQLTGPQKAPTRIRRPYRNHTEYEPGDLLSFRYAGRTALLLVVSHFRTGDGTFPVVLIAPEVDRTDFSTDELMRLPLLSVDWEQSEAFGRARMAAAGFEPPGFKFAREVAVVRPGDDKAHVATASDHPEALCLVTLSDLTPLYPDAEERRERTSRVGRWEVPDQVAGVFRNSRWAELPSYLEASLSRGWG
jgi:hypothetical protein